jgi:hypothetical protein
MLREHWSCSLYNRSMVQLTLSGKSATEFSLPKYAWLLILWQYRFLEINFTALSTVCNCTCLLSSESSMKAITVLHDHIELSPHWSTTRRPSSILHMWLNERMRSWVFWKPYWKVLNISLSQWISFYKILVAFCLIHFVVSWVWDMRRAK